MPLEPIDPSLLEQIQPQAEVYMEELMQKLGVLLNQTPKIEGLDYKHGSYADFFRLHQKKYMHSRMVWDGKPGKLHFLGTLEFSIVFSAFLMGQAEVAIAEKVAKKDFDDGLREAYGEVSNQLYGGLNQLFIAKIDKGIHLTLEHTGELPEDGSANTENFGDDAYLFIIVDIKIGELKNFTLIAALPDAHLPDIFGVSLGGDGGSGADLAKALDKMPAESIMDKTHPTMDIKQSIGDAYDLMEEKKVDTLPLTEDGKVVRVVTKNNIEIIRSIFFDAPGQEERISRLMCLPLAEVNRDQKLVLAKPQDSVKSIVQSLVKFNITSVPVVNEAGELAGMVTSNRVLELVSKDAG